MRPYIGDIIAWLSLAALVMLGVIFGFDALDHQLAYYGSLVR